MKPGHTLAVILAITLALSGCAEMNSISHHANFPKEKEGEVITVDAKQRHLYLNPEFEPSGTGGEANFVKWRICAEAAPDVFSALASSGSMKVDLSSSPSAQGGFSMAETAATIQRTQSLNLIRESFYRTCERFASGAMSRTQFIVQAARDQRAMISILAIEQLTGAVRPPATVIMGPGTNASASSNAEGAALVRTYRERFDSAKSTRIAAEATLKEAKKEGGACEDETKCGELTAAVDTAKEKESAALGELENAATQAGMLGDSASGGTLSGTNSTGGITYADISTANLSAVAESVVAISKAAVIDEPLMFCIAALSEPDQVGIYALNADSKTKIVDTCLNILFLRAQADDLYISQKFSFTKGAGEQILAQYAKS